jgi:hypothetical protein
MGAAVLVAACSSAPDITLADKSLMSKAVMAQEERVQEAYRFALFNREHLADIPCYCGCVGLGHRNNYECYFKPESTPDTPVFDDHALGCGVCVDTTHLVMDMIEVRVPAATIRASVDSRFGEFGPSTDVDGAGKMEMGGAE